MIARRTLARNGRETDRRCSTAIQLDGPHPIFGEDQTKESVQQLAEANFLPATRMEIVFTPIVVNTGPGLVLFDSGNSAERRPGAGNLVAALRAAGFDPAQIDVVVITHMHPDLVEGRASFRLDRRRRDAGSGERRAAFGPDHLPRDEGEVVPGIHGLNAFGHTPGHMA